MVNATTGAEGAARTESGAPAETLVTCLKRVEPSTSSTAPNTAEQEAEISIRLQILQQALRDYIETGGDVKMLQHPKGVAIFLSDVLMVSVLPHTPAKSVAKPKKPSVASVASVARPGVASPDAG